MAEARWCDYRDHPYRGGREGTIMLGQTQKMQNGQQSYVQQDVREICPECAAEMGFNPEYKAPEETPAERKALLQATTTKKKLT